MKLRWVLLFTALTVFLTACPPTTTPGELGVSLTATPTTLPVGGGDVALVATVTNGPADQVEFFQGDTSLNVDTEAPYEFTVTNVIVATTFRAVATKVGITANSENVSVTVEAPTAVTLTLAATPNPVPVGGAPVKLDATITAGQSRVASVAFSIKGQTAVLNTDSAAPYSFTTTTPVTAATTFVATAKDAAGAMLGTAEVAVTVGAGTPVPAGATIADTLAEILAAPGGNVPGATIAVTADIACTGDPCIPLKVGQELLGASADGTTLLSTPTRKITTNGSGARVIEMANNTEVGGFDFVGTGIFNAVDAPATITGAVTVRNIRVGTAINDPLKMSSSGAVTMTGVEFTTTRQVFIQNFTTATLTGLKVTINRPAVNTGAAMTIVSGAEPSALVLDGLDLTTNLGGTNKDGLLIQSGINFDDPDPDDIGAMTATVKNSKVIFGAGVNLANSIAFNFNIPVAGTLAIQTAASTGNSTNSTSPVRATYDAVVPGVVEGRLTPEQPVQP